MKKRDELTSQNSCMSKARDDEMTFVLLARDACAPVTIRMWVEARVLTGKNGRNDPQIVEALAAADEMERYRKESLEKLTEETSAGIRGYKSAF